MVKTLLSLLLVAALVTGGFVWFDATDAARAREGRKPVYQNHQELQEVCAFSLLSVLGCYGLYRLWLYREKMKLATIWAENGGVYTRNNHTNIRL